MPAPLPEHYSSIDDIYRNLEHVQRRRRGLFSRFGLFRQPRINYLLFVLTALTTFSTAYILHGTIAGGLWFSGGIMSILLAHEMGHYLMCRKYGVAATLPFFIPFPPMINPFGLPPIWNPFGTMGAVIKMEGRMPDRRALFDIGAGGPIGGLIFTIPALYFGIKMSKIESLQELSDAGVMLGESLFFKGLAYLAIGNLPEGYDIVLHPLAFAGWAGLFVTALNLFPIGQLDGGHIVYSLFGERSRFIYPLVLSVFIVISIVFYVGWIPLILLLFIFRIDHPPSVDPYTGLDPVRRNLALALLVVFLLSFTPVPFQVGL